MRTNVKLGKMAGLFLCLLLLDVSVCSGADLVEPTRTLREPGKTWGGLTIFSEPPRLEVYLNGEKVGQTPLWLRDVESGIHTVKIGDAETSIRVEAGERLKVGLFKGSVIQSSEPLKEEPAVEKEEKRAADTRHTAPSEEEKRRRDLTMWEKFVNGTLGHF